MCTNIHAWMCVVITLSERWLEEKNVALTILENPIDDD